MLAITIMVVPLVIRVAPPVVTGWVTMDFADLTLHVDVGSGGPVGPPVSTTITTTITAVISAPVITAIIAALVTTPVITAPISAVIIIAAVAAVIVVVAWRGAAAVTSIPATTWRRATTRGRSASARTIVAFSDICCGGEGVRRLLNAIAQVVGVQLVVQLIKGGVWVAIDGGDERVVVALVEAIKDMTDEFIFTK
jgi:hypothetical protein